MTRQNSTKMVSLRKAEIRAWHACDVRPLGKPFDLAIGRAVALQRALMRRVRTEARHIHWSQWTVLPSSEGQRP